METILSPSERQPGMTAPVGRTVRKVRTSYRRRLDPHAHRKDWHEQQATPLLMTLGWFSIGLGVAQLVAPRTLGTMAGIKGRTKLMRAIGTREIMSGIGILNRAGHPGWLWSRVAGDAMDLMLLSVAARKASRGQRQRMACATAAVAAMTALDVLASVRQSRAMHEAQLSLILEKSISVNRAPDAVYQFWRNIDNFPRFMRRLDSVSLIGGNRSHWCARGPFGRRVEWDVEMTIDDPGKMLAWRSLDAAGYAGSVRFESASGGHATIVHVDIDYRSRAGGFGAIVARLLRRVPESQVEDDLRRAKQLLESGEIPTIDGQSSGRRSMLARLIGLGAHK
jgi:uncharacterized membrane protein